VRGSNACAVHGLPADWDLGARKAEKCRRLGAFQVQTVNASAALPDRGRLSTMLLLVATSTAPPSAESSMPKSDRHEASPVASSLWLRDKHTVCKRSNL
jgi:hypothetical protein